ncbi:MAG: sensor histidine kinase [Microcoleaceae cyanobacterium]
MENLRQNDQSTIGNQPRSEPDPNSPKPERNLADATKSWKAPRLFRETRTRILAWYTLLMASLVGLSIPIFTRLVILQVDQRVREDLSEEIASFQQSVELQTLVEKETNPARIFDAFLYDQVPADKTFLITTINGKFYRSSPLSLPESISRDSAFIKKLVQTTQPVWDVIDDPREGKIIYKAEPLKVNQQVLGLLIVANITAGEREEVLEAIFIVIDVLFSLFIIALILAWLISGRVLRPIRSLIYTAHAISETDLSQRISYQGKGEMAELAETFNSMMDRLEKAFVSQQQLVNDVSHELRTPIAIVQGHLESLDYYSAEEKPEVIKIVLDELDRMTRFLEDLLLLARSERQDFLIFKEVDLAQFTEEVYLKARALGRRNWVLETKGIGQVKIDPHRVTQAILNLIQNAIQHTQETDTITIGSAVEQYPNRCHLYLWVRDTGVGIAPQDQDRIFQRFVRGENSQGASQGAGLGLAIVTAIVESHGGHVELHSQLGQGSMFTLVLFIHQEMGRVSLTSHKYKKRQ